MAGSIYRLGGECYVQPSSRIHQRQDAAVQSSIKVFQLPWRNQAGTVGEWSWALRRDIRIIVRNPRNDGLNQSQSRVRGLERGCIGESPNGKVAVRSEAGLSADKKLQSSAAEKVTGARRRHGRTDREFVTRGAGNDEFQGHRR